MPCPRSTQCILPIGDDYIQLVTGGQQYRGNEHIGIDFRFDTNGDGVEVIAPCGWEVTEVRETTNPSNGSLMWSVNISYSADWNIFIVFEPDTNVAAAVQQQRNWIDFPIVVGILDGYPYTFQVTQGQILGKLVVRDPQISGFDWYPHIHFTISRNARLTQHVCPRDYLTPEAKTALDTLYGGFNPPLLPVCLESPPDPTPDPPEPIEPPRNLRLKLEP